MDKQQLKIPSYIWIIAAILLVCILFLIFVQVPFSQKFPTYERNHNSAEAQINKYNDYLARADSVQKSIDEMKKKYDEESEKLFVNAKTSSGDIRKMLKKLDYDLSTLSIAKGVIDSQKRTSSTGDALYSTVINYSFTASYQKMLETLSYLESESDGAYFISNMSISPVVEKDADGNEISMNKNATAMDYDVVLTINLYYFNPDVKVESSSLSSSS